MVRSFTQDSYLCIGLVGGEAGGARSHVCPSPGAPLPPHGPLEFTMSGSYVSHNSEPPSLGPSRPLRTPR